MMAKLQILVIFVLLINVIYANSFTIKNPARCNSLLLDSVDKPSCRIFDFMKLIPLSTKGKLKGLYSAQVDDDVYEYLIQWNWNVVKMGKTRYAMRIEKANEVRKTFIMHRVILNLTDSSICVDHINLDGLCNIKSNLRTCNRQQNGCNRKGWDNGQSKYKGVCWVSNKQKRVKRWFAAITLNRKKVWTGYYHTELEAAKAYDEAAKKYHGEFANLNFNQ